MNPSGAVQAGVAAEAGEGTEVRLSPRVAGLRRQALAFANEPDPAERGWAVMKSYDETRAEPMVLRRAKAVAACLRSETLGLDEGDLLAGRVRRKTPAHTGIHEGNRWVNSAAYPDYGANPQGLKGSPAPADFVAYLKDWAKRQTFVHEKVRALCPPETRAAMGAGAFHASGVDAGHRLPRFQLILEKGAEALKQEALRRMAGLDLTRAESVRKRPFYQALVAVYDAAIGYGERWAAKLSELARQTPEAARQRELEQMAEQCRHGLARPARTFWEALQTVWFTVIVNQAECTGSATSLGRLDQYLYPYYQADIEAGRVTKEQALELMECFFLKCYGTFDFHHTSLGGMKPDGGDGTNELSYLCLEAVERLRTPRDIAVRVHKGAPKAFLRRAAEVARLGLGRPDFWNDETMVEALRKAGYPIEDARDYAPIGCVEVTIPGKCNSRTMGQAMNLAKILEITLNGGRDGLTGKRVGLEEGTDFPTYESLHAAYRRQAARFIRMAIEEDMRGYVTQASELPLPVLSAFTEGCLESGRDVTDGGAVYSPSGVNLFGVANVADSLAAIRKLVYEEKRIALEELRQALAANFEGREALRQMLRTGAPKFGNDEPYVDRIAAEEIGFYCDEIAKYPTPEGGRHLPLLFGTTTQSLYGLGPKTAALPDGRGAKEPLAMSVNPAPGRNVSGITAEMNSASRIDYTKAAGGVSYIVDLHPTAVEGEEALEKLVSLLRTFFEQGGAEIGLNVVGEEELRQAQAYPDRYSHLMVRVFGFSTQFVSLAPELQELIIQKTRHCR